MFGRKSRQAELGQRPPGFWSQISRNLWFHPLPRLCVCLQGGKYVNTRQAQPSAPLGCPSCLSEEARAWRGGYTRAPALDCTTQGSHRKPTGRTCNCSFLCWESAALQTHTHPSSQGNVSVVLGSGGKLSSTTHPREGYLPVCVSRGGEAETLCRLPPSSQLPSSPPYPSPSSLGHGHLPPRHFQLWLGCGK